MQSESISCRLIINWKNKKFVLIPKYGFIPTTDWLAQALNFRIPTFPAVAPVKAINTVSISISFVLQLSYPSFVIYLIFEYELKTFESWQQPEGNQGIVPLFQ